jgi:hypothetical protein
MWYRPLPGPILTLAGGATRALGWALGVQTAYAQSGCWTFFARYAGATLAMAGAANPISLTAAFILASVSLYEYLKCARGSATGRSFK